MRAGNTFWIPGPRERMQLFVRRLAARPVPRRHRALRPRRHVPLDRASLRWESWRDVPVRCGARSLGVRLQSLALPARPVRASRSRPLSTSFSASSGQGASRSSPIRGAPALPAARFAGAHPELIDRVVLFGPIARRTPRRYERPPGAPAGQIICPRGRDARAVACAFRRIGRAVPRQRSGERRHDPSASRSPQGPFNDIIHAWHGELAYEPGLVRAPDAMIHGE